MIYRILCASALVSLAACGGAGDAGKGAADAPAAEASAETMKPGQWQATAELVSVSGPNATPEATKGMVGTKNDYTYCLTAEQLAKPSLNVFGENKGYTCQSDTTALEDGKVSGQASCKSDNDTNTDKFVLNGTYGAESFEITMDTNMPTVALDMKTRITAKRVGECTAAANPAQAN